MTASPAAPLPAADPFTPPAPRRRLDVRSADGTRLNVEVHGPEDAPTVVLIHGWTCSIRFWAPVIRALAPEPGAAADPAAGLASAAAEPAPPLRVVAYDQRGHGRSETPDRSGYSVQALVDDLAAVLDATLPAGCTAVAAGHSMGGMTLMAAAGSDAVLARLGGAVLASTGFARLPGRARVVPLAGALPGFGHRAHRVILRTALPLGPVNPLSRAQLKYTALGPKADRRLAQANAQIIHACRPEPRAAWGRVLCDLDLTGTVGRFAVPTAVVFGTADRLTPTAHAETITAALPDCVGLTLLPGLGHMTPMEAPETLAALIRTRVAAAADPKENAR